MVDLVMMILLLTLISDSLGAGREPLHVSLETVSLGKLDPALHQSNRRPR